MEMDSALPADVIRDIGRWLPQTDLLHLAFTCKRLYKALHGEIYKSIAIDSAKRVYDADLSCDRAGWFIDGSWSIIEPVVIRSLFGLTRFLKTLVAHPEHARLVRVLVAREKIPDIPLFELHTLLEQVSPLLVNLHALNWYLDSHPLRADLLTRLRHPERLQSLCGNFSQLGTAAIQRDYAALRYVDFSNLGSSTSLRAIDLSMLPKVESLVMSGPCSASRLAFTTLLKDCCQMSLGSKSEVIGPFSRETKNAASILHLLSPKLQHPVSLRSLVLRGLCIKASDASLILQKIDTSGLHHFSLDNCFEILFEDLLDGEQNIENSVLIRRHRPPALTFLDILIEGLRSVPLIHIGLSNELCYNLATFKAIANLDCLTKLSVHIKSFRRNGPVDLAPLIDSIQTHKGTLEHLDICSDVVDQISAQSCLKKRNYFELTSILGLDCLHQLKFLRLPTSYSQIEKLPYTLSGLKSIEVIQLLVTDTDYTISSSCGSCPYTSRRALCNSNSLIAQEFLTCTNSFVADLEQEYNQNFYQFALIFKNVFSTLSYLRFDLQQLTQVFDCSLEVVQLRGPAYADNFDTLVCTIKSY